MAQLKNIIFVLAFAAVSECFPQKFYGEFTQQEFSLSREKLGFFMELFETKQQMLDFLEINKGEVIAEVGAGDGCNMGVLSMLYDSLTLYAQDIDPKTLSESKFKKTIQYYSKKRKTKQTNKFNRVIGTISSTNLPDATFDKIFLIDAYHDFDKKDEMIEDMSKKLKPNGKIIILDGFSFPGDTVTCPDNRPHVLTTLPIEIKRFSDHGFFLVKISRPDYRGAHHGNGLIFQKNKNISDELMNRKNAIERLALATSRLAKKEVAENSTVVVNITDSILPEIKIILSAYPEFEAWLKDLGAKHLRKGNTLAAIHIFKMNTTLFPDSYQSWFWLGVAHQENKQKEEAKKCFNTSLKINPKNSVAEEKRDRLDKTK